MLQVCSHTWYLLQMSYSSEDSKQVNARVYMYVNCIMHKFAVTQA